MAKQNKTKIHESLESRIFGENSMLKSIGTGNNKAVEKNATSYNLVHLSDWELDSSLHNSF